MADETSFSNTSWQGLIDYGIGRGPAQQAAAAIEASRRSIDATRSLDVTMQAAATASVEHAERLEAAAAASSEQTDKVIDLNLRVGTHVERQINEPEAAIIRRIVRSLD